MRDVVLVEWVDTQVLDPYLMFGLDELENVKPVLMRTVGFLIRNDEECIVLSKEFIEESKQVRIVHVIPKCCVKKIKKLKGW